MQSNCKPTLPETDMAPGILLSFWDGLLSGAMLVSGSAVLIKTANLISCNHDSGLRWCQISTVSKKTISIPFLYVCLFPYTWFIEMVNGGKYIMYGSCWMYYYIFIQHIYNIRPLKELQNTVISSSMDFRRNIFSTWLDTRNICMKK